MKPIMAKTSLEKLKGYNRITAPHCETFAKHHFSKVSLKSLVRPARFELAAYGFVDRASEFPNLLKLQ